jgi:hypothetical protein
MIERATSGPVTWSGGCRSSPAQRWRPCPFSDFGRSGAPMSWGLKRIRGSCSIRCLLRAPMLLYAPPDPSCVFLSLDIFLLDTHPLTSPREWSHKGSNHEAIKWPWTAPRPAFIGRMRFSPTVYQSVWRRTGTVCRHKSTTGSSVGRWNGS